MIFHKSEYRERREHFAYFACSVAPAGFDTQCEAFLGSYRGWDRPLAVEEGRSRDSIAHGWSPCGSHRIELVLEPGESREIVFVLGYAENPRDAKFDPPGSQLIDKRRVRPVLDRYRDPAEVESAFERLRDYWTELLAGLQVSTPSEHVDRTVNIWNQYQCMVTFNLSRSASLFESGIGRGMGFRDSNQDLLGFVHLVPERARARILDLAATQLPDGGAYHQYQPLTKRGNDAVGSGFNDDPLWLILARGRVSQGDGRRLDPARAGSVRQRGGLGGHRSTSTSAAHSVTRSTGSAPRPAPDRARRLERLLEPELLLRDAGRVVPDDGAPRRRHRGVGVHRRPVRPGGRRARGDRRRWSATRARRPQPSRRGSGWRGTVRRARLGRAVVPSRLRPRGRPVGSAENDEGQIFIEPQGMCVMAGLGLDDGLAGPGTRLGARPACHAARDRARPACVLTLPARARRDHVLSAGLQGERVGLLPHEPVDRDRRVPRRERRRGARLLPAHEPVRAGRDQRRPSLRAVRLRTDDRRPRRTDASGKRRTRGSPARRRGPSSRSPSGSWESVPSTTAFGSIRACRATGRALPPSAVSGEPPSGSRFTSHAAFTAACRASSSTASESPATSFRFSRRGASSRSRSN